MAAIRGQERARAPMVPLIVDGGAVACTVTVLLLDLAGLRRRGHYFRWQAAGILLAMTAMLASEFAEQRGWPPSHLHAVKLIAVPAMLTGAALLATGLLVQARARNGTSIPPGN
jgi:Protein of unknown function (DUF2637)